MIRCCVVLLAGLLTPLSATSEQAGAVNVECGNRVARVVFWPQGNPALSGQAGGAASHVEVYRGTSTTFQASDRVAYADTERVTVADRCNEQRPRYHLAQMAEKRRVRAPIALRCVLPSAPVINVGDLTASSGRVTRRSLGLEGKDRKVLYANVGATAADAPLLQYDARVCHEIDLPT
jgi:hypothetical protein